MSCRLGWHHTVFWLPVTPYGPARRGKATAERLRLLTPIVVGRTTQFRDPVQSELFLSGLRLAAGETRPPPAAFVAIFAANAAGYSRLTGVDAEATLAAIRDRF